MMSGPELPYKISSSEEALTLLSMITKRVDDLRKIFDNLCLLLDKVHQQNQTMLRYFKLQMQPQAVPVSDLPFLINPTSMKIVV